ncbi:MAG TPA: hypothetical protein VK775_08445 [Chthoniobacterales bacterium]|jgi:hypothetical protein|nr:hypothetical protein [Chthoniobacterales bacterium]
MPGTPEKSESFVAMQIVPEARLWAERAAARLWMLQVSFADDPASTRHEYLVEEIERSIKDVAESRHSEYLSALMERFPGPERIDASYITPPEAETVQRGPQEVADELVARLPEFSNEAKAALGRKLQALGLFVAPSRGIELPLELLGKLGMTPQEALDEERLIKLFTALLEIVVTLDHLIWNVWKNVAPRSSIRREEGSDNPRRTIGRYLAGDREVNNRQITQMLEKTRQLTGGLLSAIGPAGEIFARKHLERFAPEKIRAGVELKGPGFIPNVEVKCWRRYVELAADLSGHAVETQIVDGIVAYTEELISKSEMRAR